MAEEGGGARGAGAKGSCKQPDVGAGRQTDPLRGHQWLFTAQSSLWTQTNMARPKIKVSIC